MNHTKNPGKNFLRVEIKMNECEVTFFLLWTKSTKQKTRQADVHFTRVSENCLPGFKIHYYLILFCECIADCIAQCYKLGNAQGLTAACGINFALC